MRQPNIDTDRIRDWRELRSELEELCVRTSDGCLLYPVETITVRLSGTTQRLNGVSVARVAFMLANPTTHLGPDDFAVHICRFGTNPDTGDPRACCEPTHIRKGQWSDVAVMIEARRRGLILEGTQ